MIIMVLYIGLTFVFGLYRPWLQGIKVRKKLWFSIYRPYFCNHVTSLTPHLGSATKAYGGAAIVSNDELRKIRDDIEKGKGASNREAAILSQADIARMKASTKI